MTNRQPQPDHNELIVVGMHRSGTSCLAGALSLAGAFPGEEQDLKAPGIENPKGFFELQAMREFCDGALMSVGSDWWNISSFSLDRIPHDKTRELLRAAAKLLEGLTANGPCVVKEPRLCVLLPLLLRVTRNPVIVHIVRNPFEVARSLRVRNGFGIAQGLALWEAYNRSAIEVSAGLPQLRVNYRDLRCDPVGTMGTIVDRLEALGVQGLSRPDTSALKRFVSGLLRHEKVEEQWLPEVLAAPQLELWELVQTSREVDPVDLPRATKVMREGLLDLERTKVAFDELVELRAESLRFAKTNVQFEELRDKARELRETETQLKQRRRDLEEQNNVLGLRASELESGIADARAENARLIQELSEARTGVEQLQRRQSDLKARVAELDRKMAAHAEESVILISMLDEKNHANRALTHEVRMLNQGRSLLRRLRYRFFELRKQAKLLQDSDLFDEGWYFDHYPDVRESGESAAEHYLRHGAYEDRDPGPGFDSAKYLRRNPDVEQQGANPLVHYLLFGHAEGRKPF